MIGLLGLVGQERVAEDLEPAGVRFASGATEGVDGRADLDVGEPGVAQDLAPVVAGEAAGYAVGPQVDVADGVGGYGSSGLWTASISTSLAENRLGS